jgi:hypothetical protein
MRKYLPRPPFINPDSHHILLAPALAMAISPKSNPVRLSLVMSSRDLTGAPQNIAQDCLSFTFLFFVP